MSKREALGLTIGALSLYGLIFLLTPSYKRVSEKAKAHAWDTFVDCLERSSTNVDKYAHCNNKAINVFDELAK